MMLNGTAIITGTTQNSNWRKKDVTLATVFQLPIAFQAMLITRSEHLPRLAER